jgi:tetratricopeptide (TPR) repeat protein
MPNENPIRILVITSRPLTDTTGNPIMLLDVAEERQRMRRALNLSADSSLGSERAGVRVHFLREATTGEVKNAMNEPWDIVHIAGYGTSDGMLLLEDGFGEAQALPPAQVAQLFESNPPSLVFVSAYFSEPIARGLNAAGIPTLVAVDARRPIANSAAIVFAKRFYSTIAKGWRVGDAFREAQQAVALDEQVGDARPPLDDDGKPEEPWSQRFRLIGDAGIAFEGRGVGEPVEIGAVPGAAGNLRERNAHFAGRAREIVEIVRAFEAERMPRVAIVGASGLGKTELSRAVAWWYMERGCVDAVLWASVSRDEDEFILRDLASLLLVAQRALNLTPAEQMPFDEQKRIVGDTLAAHRTLIILDNWDALEGYAREEVWDFVKQLPDTTHVIVTSRDNLPMKDVLHFELDTLPHEDAARLFVTIARNAVDLTRDRILNKHELAILDMIITRVGGYPLAVEVVAGQLESRALSEIWNDLAKLPQSMFEGKDELTGEPRVVWTSLSLSYDSLPMSEQALFSKMCVVLGPTAAEDIAAIIRIANPRPILDTLVRRSLVRTRAGAYALLPIVRAYAESKFTETGASLFELYMDAVKHYQMKGTLDGRIVSSDYLFAILSRYLVPEIAKRFIGYAYSIYLDLIRSGRWGESKRKAEQLVRISRGLRDRGMEGLALNLLADKYRRTGEYPKVEELHKLALKLLRESDTTDILPIELLDIGSIKQLQRSYSDAEAMYKEALKLAEEQGNRSATAKGLLQIAILKTERGYMAEAKRACRECLRVFRQLGDKLHSAKALHQLGIIEKKQEHFDRAVRLIDEAIKLYRVLDDKMAIAHGLNDLAVMNLSQDRDLEAKQFLLESLDLKTQLGDRRGISGTLNNLAAIETKRKNYARASQLLEQSLAIKKEIADTSRMGSTLYQLGIVANEQGNVKEALEYFIDAIPLFEEFDPSGLDLLRKQAGMICIKVGEDLFGRWIRELLEDDERAIKLMQEIRQIVSKEGVEDNPTHDRHD